MICKITDLTLIKFVLFQPYICQLQNRATLFSGIFHFLQVIYIPIAIEKGYLAMFTIL